MRTGLYRSHAVSYTHLDVYKRQVYKKYDLRQPEDISGKELSGGILLHTEIPPFYVDVI